MHGDFRPFPNKNVQMLDHFFPLLGTSHRFLRCQVVLSKRCHYYYCHYCYCHCCHYYYCHNLSFWVLPPFNCLSFVTIWAFEFCQFDFLSFVPICFSEFCLNSCFFFSFWHNWVFEFFQRNIYLFLFLSKFQFLVLSKEFAYFERPWSFFLMKSRLQNVFGVCLFPNILKNSWFLPNPKVKDYCRGWVNALSRCSS